MRVADLCSPQGVTVEPGATLREAALLMRNPHVGALQGIVTLDVRLRVRATELGGLAEGLRGGRMRERDTRAPIRAPA